MLLHFLQHVPTSPAAFTVVFFGEGTLTKAVRAIDAIDVRVIEAGRLRQVHRYVSTVREVATLVREESIDLIFSWTGKPHLYGGMVSALTGVPAAWYQLGIPEGRHLSWIDRLTNLLPTAGVVTLSARAQQAQRRLWPQRDVSLVYPCYDASAFDPHKLPSPSEARAQLGLPAGRPLLGMVGRLQEWKGMHTLIRAMPDVLRKVSDAQAVIVGGTHDLEPAYGDRLRRLVADLGISSAVKLVGYQSNVPLWMQAMDLCIHASDNEPFGIVIIEALALGKPVIAGSAGGPTEILEDGETGLLVPFEDHEGLAAAITDLLANNRRREDLAQAGQQVARTYHPSRYAQRLVDTMLDFCASTGPVRSQPNIMTEPQRS